MRTSAAPQPTSSALWRVATRTEFEDSSACTITWENYAFSSIDATRRAIRFVRHELQRVGFIDADSPPATRVTEVLQVGT